MNRPNRYEYGLMLTDLIKTKAGQYALSLSCYCDQLEERLFRMEVLLDVYKGEQPLQHLTVEEWEEWALKDE